MEKFKRAPRDLEELQQAIRISVEADPGLADILSDYLVGILNAAVEYAVGKDGDEVVTMHAFIGVELYSEEVRHELEQRLQAYGAEIASICKLPAPRVSSERLQSEDWAEKWKEYFKPFEIVPGLVIVPSWESYSAAEGTQVIVMDPGMAFGTGHHATTRLCLGLLKPLVQNGTISRVLDVGTGTGILAMTAALFGAGQVTGIDNDHLAVAAARGNCAKNNLEGRVTISGRDLVDVNGPFEVVVANIVHDVLCALADELARLTAEAGYLVLSGVLAGSQVQSLGTEFAARGFTMLEEVPEGDWRALLFKKVNSGAV